MAHSMEMGAGVPYSEYQENAQYQNQQPNQQYIVVATPTPIGLSPHSPYSAAPAGPGPEPTDDSNSNSEPDRPPQVRTIQAVVANYGVPISSWQGYENDLYVGSHLDFCMCGNRLIMEAKDAKISAGVEWLPYSVWKSFALRNVCTGFTFALLRRWIVYWFSQNIITILLLAIPMICILLPVAIFYSVLLIAVIVMRISLLPIVLMCMYPFVMPETGPAKRGTAKSCAIFILAYLRGSWIFSLILTGTFVGGLFCIPATVCLSPPTADDPRISYCQVTKLNKDGNPTLCC